MLQQHYYARGRYAPVLVRSSCTYQRTAHTFAACRAEAELIVAKMGVVDGSESLGKWLRACLPAHRSPFDAIPVAPYSTRDYVCMQAADALLHRLPGPVMQHVAAGPVRLRPHDRAAAGAQPAQPWLRHHHANLHAS